MFRKLLLYLGLGPDEAYEEFMNDDPVRRGGVLSSGDFLEDAPRRFVAASKRRIQRNFGSPIMPETTGTVRTIQPAVVEAGKSDSEVI